MSLVVYNGGLLDHALDERGIVTLVEQVRGQFPSRFVRGEVFLAVTPYQQTLTLLEEGDEVFPLLLEADVVLDGFGDGLSINARCRQLPGDLPGAVMLLLLGPDESRREPGVVEPLLFPQPLDRFVDFRVLELLALQL